MRILNKIIVFFYTLIFSLIGASLIFISLHLAGYYDISFLLDYVFAYPNLPLLLGLSGGLLILVSLTLMNVSFKKFQSEKTIGYSAEGGQVIISLGAIEDFIRRLTQHMPEVKELRSAVFVTRKGIEIESRVVLWSTSNIPEITEKVQSMIKSQVGDLLSGIDKTVIVNVHVVKIAPTNEKIQKTKQEIPFLR